MDDYTRALRNTFVADSIDRLHQNREDTDWLEKALSDPESRFFLLVKDSIVITSEASPYSQIFYSGIALALASQATSVILLGRVEEHLYFALAYEEMPVFDAKNNQLCDLRDIATDLNPDESALLAQAKGMVVWHRHNQFCSVCGTPTRSTEAGYTRICTNPACGQLHFPRTDPAVIVLVTEDNRCLLGRQARWAKGRYSNIAGFVEPGESLETAVAREVWEETGIRLEAIHYHSSQPWTFPSSLMLGFNATASSRTINRNDGELEDARWFTREELRTALSQGTVSMPSTYSISFHLIEDWFDAGDCGELRDYQPLTEMK
ncbi:MAG: NAD(+) diphosphatase [Anaerolineales bacterium]|nr:MAG: NAD(+) diphosphatase [Anaerolineales bacterium]